MKQEKVFLYLLTIVIDCVLLYIMFMKNIEMIDKLFIIVTLISHLIFYYALFIENCILLDILHIFIFILSFLAIFVKNIYIKLVVIGLLVCIQILWIVKKKCILHSFPTNLSTFGFGNSVQIFVLLIFIILVYQIYHFKSLNKY